MICNQTKNKFKKYRILAIVFVVIVFLVINYYPCLSLNFISLPEKVANNKEIKDVLILYGSGVCNSCSPGKYLYSLRERKDILIILPKDYSKYDIENLKDVFELKGTVINGDEAVLKLLRKINSCKDLDMLKANFHLKLGENGKISSVKVL